MQKMVCSEAMHLSHSQSDISPYHWVTVSALAHSLQSPLTLTFFNMKYYVHWALIKALCYKPEGHGLEPREDEFFFQFT
jgi:hypothetical protein